MSIDAIINKVIKDNENLILDLMAREIDGYVGQPTLTILNFTHKPVAGQKIWGGADSCIIEPSHGITKRKYYHRVGYLRLEEKE